MGRKTDWRMDSPRVSGPVLAEFIHIFYHSNAFYNEFIEFKSIKLKLDTKIDVPVLNLYKPHGAKDRLVPPDASTALSGMVVKRSLYDEVRFDYGHIGMFIQWKEKKTKIKNSRPSHRKQIWLGEELFKLIS